MEQHSSLSDKIITIAGTEYRMIGAEFAQGGQAVLYQAISTNSDLSREFMIKRFNGNESSEEYFEREKLAQTVAANSHQALFLSAFYDRKQDVSVMLKAPSDCKTVQDILIEWEVSSPKSPDMQYPDLGRLVQGIQITKSILGALNRVHEADVLHLDISAGNVMWAESIDRGTAYLLDFSCCAEIGQVVDTVWNGTRSFSAPELQIPGETLTPAADLYSVGALLLLLAVGKQVTNGGRTKENWNLPELPGYGNLNIKPYVKKLAVYPGCRSVLEDILIKATTRTGMHYESAPEMLQDLIELENTILNKGITRPVLLNGSQRYYQEQFKEIYKNNFDMDLLAEVDGDLLNGNTLLVADGGAGKTTVLFSVWKKCLDSITRSFETPLPVYVSLTGFDPRKKTWETYIFDYILENYYKAAKDENGHSNLSQLLESGKYLFLLDGINESVSSNDLGEQVSKLIKYPDVTVCLTSRHSDISWDCIKQFKTVNLLPLSEEIINQKLHNKGFSSATGRLLETLKRPMFLSLYLGLGDSKQQIQTPGEILLAHHKRLKDMYTEGYHSQKQQDIREFVLYRLLPEFAFKINVMSFDSEKALGIIKGMQFSGLKHRKIVKHFEEDELTNEMITVLQECGILRKIGENQITGIEYYVFCHQSYLEFYQGYYIQQQMEKMPQGSPLPQCLYGGPLADAVAGFLGEIWHEHDFADKVDSDSEPSPIEEWMQMHLVGQNSYKAQMVVRNLIEVMKRGRDRRITANYSGLNLSLSNFYDCFLPNSNFSNAEISESTFVRQGHRQLIDKIAILNSTKTLITASQREDYLCVWDIATGQVLQKIKCRTAIHDFDISPDEQSVLVDYGNGSVAVYRLCDGKEMNKLSLCEKNKGTLLNLWKEDRKLIVRFCTDSHTVICTSGVFGQDRAEFWNIDHPANGRPIIQLTDGYTKMANATTRYCALSVDRKKLYCISSKGELTRWDLCQKKW